MEKELSVAELQAQLAEQKEINAKNTEALAGLMKIVGIAKTVETAAVKPPTIPTEAVKVAGKSYLFRVASFQLPGSRDVLISEEVATDEKLLQSLLKIDGQGILKEVL